MSLGWVCCGRVQYLPEDIEQCTIFVDILHNDQNSPDIKKELAVSELEYRWALYHLVLGTALVFSGEINPSSPMFLIVQVGLMTSVCFLIYLTC